jgi:hypothetical protein
MKAIQRKEKRGRPLDGGLGYVNVMCRMPVEFANFADERGLSCSAMAKKLLHEAMERELSASGVKLAG